MLKASTNSNYLKRLKYIKVIKKHLCGFIFPLMNDNW